MRRVILAIAIVGALAGCGSKPPSMTGTASPHAIVKHAVVDLMYKPSLGTDALSDATTGATLYRFTPDGKAHTATCVSSACLSLWRPVQNVQDMPALPKGMKGAFAIVDRSDGTPQLTYDGWPLYYYTRDASPQDAKGQGLDGLWFAVTSATQPPGP